VPDHFEWPFSKANAAFIGAFYDQIESDGPGAASRSLAVFGAFFAVAFVWFPVPNYLVPTMLTVPLLCWGATDVWRPVQPFGRGGLADLRAVLSSGVAGGGFPGLGSWAGSWQFGPSLIPLATTVQIVVGAVLINWVFLPAAFFGGFSAWPSSFGEFDGDGHYYNATEGHYKETGEPIYLSSGGMSMYIGVALSVVGMATDSLLRAVGTLMPGRAQVGHAASAPPTAAGRAPPPPRPLSVRMNLAVAGALTIAALLVIQLLLPSYDGKPGLGMPFWGSALCIAYAFAASFGCALIYATSGQQFVGGAAILAQVVQHSIA
jgi:hypothetical protein